MIQDLDLARRLEATKVQAGTACMWGVAAVNPRRAAVAQPAAGGIAAFAGVGSPLTHALGLGMAGAVAESELDQLEQFFLDRGSGPAIDLCPLADASLLNGVAARGYRLVEFNSVLFREIDGGVRVPPPTPGLEVRRCDPSERLRWADVVGRAFFGDETPAALVETFAAMASMPDGEPFLASLDGRAVGGGTMGMWDGIAYLMTNATNLDARGRGVHTAVLAARLARAAEAGCTLAMVSVVPGTASHRNYERAGFRVAYTRTNLWCEPSDWRSGEAAAP